MRNLLFAVYVAACLLALTWPFYDLLGNRITPFVLGLPMSLVWVVGWVAASFLALTIYHLTGPRDRDDATER